MLDAIRINADTSFKIVKWHFIFLIFMFPFLMGQKYYEMNTPMV